jgi:MFS family permease
MHLIITYTMIISMPDSDRAQAPANARWIALVVVCLGQLMNIVDATIVNVALPSIQSSLHFTQANLTWVLNAYLISYGSFLLLAGRLGDLIGRRRIFLAGVTLFTLASAACGLAAGQATLIIARFVQGLGGAAATSAIVAIIATEFREPRERAKAMSVYAFVISGGGSLGLIAGGAITLVTVAMVLGAYAIVTSATYGWGSAHTLGLGGGALALLAAFVALEARLRNPIMPLRIFAVPGLAGSSVVRGLLITGMYATFFIGVLYLERLLHFGVLQTGLAFLPQTLVLAALSLGPTAALVNRYGPRVPLLVGLVLSAAGLALLARTGLDAPYFPAVVIAFLLMGAGAGLAFMPLLTIAMADVPPADAGLASGIINTSLQISAALGVAVLGTVATSHTQTLLAGGASIAAARLGGYHLAFLVAAGCVAAAVVLSAAVLRPTAPPAVAALDSAVRAPEPQPQPQGRARARA